MTAINDNPDEAVTEPRHRAFTEASLHRDIVDTWGGHGAHNDVFTFMRLEIAALRAVVSRTHRDMWKDDEGRDVMACRGLLTLPVQQADAVRRAVAGKGVSSTRSDDV